MPLTMDAFNNNQFALTSMIDPVNEMEFVPAFLESLGIFNPVPISTTNFAVESIGDTLSVIRTSPRGTDPSPFRADRRTSVSMSTVRIAQGDTIRAESLQNIRAINTTDQLVALAQVVTQRQVQIARNIRVTWENMRYGAVNGLVLDADGSVIVDWYEVFGISRPATIDFNLDAGSPAPRILWQQLQAMVREVIRGMKSPNVTTPTDLRVIGLAGDDFYDGVNSHPEYIASLSTGGDQGAGLRSGAAFSRTVYGGVEFYNVRGTDDGSVGVGTDECLFFPVSPGMDLFEVAWSPGEFLDTVNTLGRPLYPLVIPDLRRNTGVEVELYSYPMFVCKRPRALQRGIRT